MAQAPQPQYGVAVTIPAEHAAPVSPSDTTDLPMTPTRALYVGGLVDAETCDVTVMLVGGGGPITFANVWAGTILPLRVVRVMATGTSEGASIVALY